MTRSDIHMAVGMTPVRRGRRCAVGLLVLLGACSLAPEYHRPVAPVPSGWASVAPAGEDSVDPNAAVTADSDWQQVIVDPQLRALVAMALEQNRNLRQAMLRIDEARALYGIERAARLPAIGLDGTATRQRTPAGFLPPGQDAVGNRFDAAVGLNAFEIDLFGRVRNSSEAAAQQYLATEAAARMVRIALIAEVSRAYIGMVAAQAAQALAERVAENREQTLAQATLRRDAGLIAESEYDEVKAQRFAATVESERARRQAAQARHALMRLVGASTPLPLPIPTAGDAAAGLDALVFAAVPAGLSSAMITRRPDIVAAEHRLRARHADIGVARAAFFPRISLTGAAGFGSPALSDLFTGAARIWQFAPRVTVPIFSGGANRANLDIATIRRDIAVAAYEETIQTAFAEVADALAANATLQREHDAMRTQADSTKTAAALSAQRYRAGVEDYGRYLDVQQRALQTQLGLLATARDKANGRIELYRALGGGWMAAEAEKQTGEQRAEKPAETQAAKRAS